MSWDKDRTVESDFQLSKGDSVSYNVRVEFSLEDMDMSGFQKGATYEQIKAYVLEHTGLKVSSLYISQIKRKCGLDVGHNYNLSKKEDAKVPQCPPEKEVAIREAFNYFGMLQFRRPGIVVFRNQPRSSVHSLMRQTFPCALVIATYSLFLVDGANSHNFPAAYFAAVALLSITQTS